MTFPPASLGKPSRPFVWKITAWRPVYADGKGASTLDLLEEGCLFTELNVNEFDLCAPFDPMKDILFAESLDKIWVLVVA